MANWWYINLYAEGLNSLSALIDQPYNGDVYAENTVAINNEVPVVRVPQHWEESSQNLTARPMLSIR